MPRSFLFNVTNLKPRRQSLRGKSTQAEKILWERLRKENLGYKFFRQSSLEGYVMDFYCPVKRLAIEIEGSIHHRSDVNRYDTYRFRYLQAFNIKILKFSNQDIYTQIGKVLKTIRLNLRSPS